MTRNEMKQLGVLYDILRRIPPHPLRITLEQAASAATTNADIVSCVAVALLAVAASDCDAQELIDLAEARVTTARRAVGLPI